MVLFAHCVTGVMVKRKSLSYANLSIQKRQQGTRIGMSFSENPQGTRPVMQTDGGGE
jgi:hypothetical protein